MRIANGTIKGSEPVSKVSQQHQIVVGQPVDVPVATMFAYPTRLACAWEPRVMQIHLPEVTKTPAQIEISVAPDHSTRSLKNRSRNPYKIIYRQLLPPLHLHDQPFYDCRYETDENIAHLLNSIFSRVLLAKQACPELTSITLIFRQNASALAKNACQALGIPFVCTYRNIVGSLVTITPIKPVESRQEICESHYNRLFGSLEFQGYRQDTPHRVLIARKHRRCLINEAEIEQFLQAYGFVKVYYEDISIGEQWSISRNAEVIVGIHGAALHSLVFNSRGVKLIEVFHPGYVVDLYRDMMAAIGGQWVGVVGQLRPEVIKALDFKQKPRQFALSDIRVDLCCLQMALEHLDVRQIQ